MPASNYLYLEPSLRIAGVNYLNELTLLTEREVMEATGTQGPIARSLLSFAIGLASDWSSLGFSIGGSSVSKGKGKGKEAVDLTQEIENSQEAEDADSWEEDWSSDAERDPVYDSGMV